MLSNPLPIPRTSPSLQFDASHQLLKPLGRHRLLGNGFKMSIPFATLDDLKLLRNRSYYVRAAESSQNRRVGFERWPMRWLYQTIPPDLNLTRLDLEAPASPIHIDLRWVNDLSRFASMRPATRSTRITAGIPWFVWLRHGYPRDRWLDHRKSRSGEDPLG
jgi:hypothetical protein